jgi:diguanylate cyclase (GGDEF)-like protein
MRALQRIPYRRRYAVLGCILALGSPLGFLALELLMGANVSPLALLRRSAVAYLYMMVATGVVFTVVGHFLGRVHERLAALGSHDPLTGLCNRRVLEQALAEASARACRQGQPLTLLAVDVDGLKGINDRGGHDAGDAALITVGVALRAASRGSDVVARLGGDEFTVVAADTDMRGARGLAERIRTELEQRAGPRVSIGIAEGDDPARLRLEADQALYAAKRAGRNKVEASCPCG